jgi:hypothetical protein
VAALHPGRGGGGDDRGLAQRLSPDPKTATRQGCGSGGSV